MFELSLILGIRIRIRIHIHIKMIHHTAKKIAKNKIIPKDLRVWSQ